MTFSDDPCIKQSVLKMNLDSPTFHNGEKPPVKKVRQGGYMDDTPIAGSMTPGATPLMDSTPIGMSTPIGATPLTPIDFMKQADQISKMNANQFHAYTKDREMFLRNRPLTDDDLDQMLPSKGYEIVGVPPGYEAKRQSILKENMERLLTQQKLYSDSPIGGDQYNLEGDVENLKSQYGVDAVEGLTVEADGVAAGGDEGLPYIKAEDMAYFGKLATDERDEDDLGSDEVLERSIMKLLLQIKNGEPSQRKNAMRELTRRMKEFGADRLLSQVLPLLMSKTLDELERHLLVKVLDRIIYKLGEDIKPYTVRILSVIAPSLAEEERTTRAEAREVIANTAKSVGLSTMVAALKPELESKDDTARFMAARTFAVAASALGVANVRIFLKALCAAKTSWQPRHAGARVVQEIALLLGSAILPQLRELVEVVAPMVAGDTELKVRTAATLALASLAESAAPFGLEVFLPQIPVIWSQLGVSSGRVLSALIRCAGAIIPLLGPVDAANYAHDLMSKTLLKQLRTPDDEMKRTVLKVLKLCVQTNGVSGEFLEKTILPPFLENLWIPETANDRRLSRLLLSATCELLQRLPSLGSGLEPLIPLVKSSPPLLRRLIWECIGQVVRANAFSCSTGPVGSLKVAQRLEERLVDGLLFSLHQPVGEGDEYLPFGAKSCSFILLEALGVTLGALGVSAKPYLSQLCEVLKFHLGQGNSKVRQQAAEAVGKIAASLKCCGEDLVLQQLGQILYENLGEEYPDTLGALLCGLRGVLGCVGLLEFKPPMSDVLPRLTPILKNRHERVQEECIKLVGVVAERGAELVSAREWDRICFDLLELLKAPRKCIRQASIYTFGHIAKAIGPHDVMATLLNNLKVAERQLRVCTTVAIAIVAKSCGPYTVLPALLNEYKVPDVFVRNGVLKSLAFLFEHIGPDAKNYVNTVVTLFEDALMDRDPIHRQTASWAIKHLALGVAGLGDWQSLRHLLNLVWPNLFETTAHLTPAFFDAMEGLRLAVGPGTLLLYTLQGLFHPAKRVRVAYWRVYNQLYVANAEQLVAYQPPLPREPLPISQIDKQRDVASRQLARIEKSGVLSRKQFLSEYALSDGLFFNSNDLKSQTSYRSNSNVVPGPTIATLGSAHEARVSALKAHLRGGEEQQSRNGAQTYMRCFENKELLYCL